MENYDKRLYDYDAAPGRCILNVSPDACIDCYARDIRNMGFSSVKYLRHLGVLLGECNNLSISKQAVRHPYTTYVEGDLQIRLEEPYEGRISTLSTSTYPWGVRAIEAPRAWSLTKGNEIRVAVIDTGVCKEHPAIRECYKGGFNVLSEESEPEDYNGHGTHVAGTIAGRAPHLGIVGVAPKAHIYGVKTFDKNGSARLSNLLSAIDWCIENGMQVINMSFGMERPSEALHAAVKTILDKGIIMIAASGNQGYRDQIDYPSKYVETIGICSVSKNQKLSRFNNMGEGIDLAAPGDRIFSACLHQTSREMSGTSMAVPHVVGATALLLSIDDSLNTHDVKDILMESATKYDNLEGLGVLNAYNAIKYYKSN